MGCVQSYFKRAHNAGISPSSTQESNSKQPPSDDGVRLVQEERSIAEEPESNDTSYGVEATAVRTLAATTGTVAILGTTAKTGDKKDDDSKEDSNDNNAIPTTVETIHEEQEEPGTETVVIRDEVKDVEHGKIDEQISEAGSTNSRPVSITLENCKGKKDEESVQVPPSTKSEVTEEDVPRNLEDSLSNSSLSKTQTSPPEVESPVLIQEENEQRKVEESSTESTKEKEDDVSKSISSERLKTNSISNTTLSSDSIAELDNNSVKQSPSADKVIESFDSSSTVEFVDIASKESMKSEEQLEENKTNPTRSISSDLSIKVNSPVNEEKTPDIVSPMVDTILHENPVSLQTSEEITTLNGLRETPTNVGTETLLDDKPSDCGGNVTDSNNIFKEHTISEESPLNSEVSSNISSNVQANQNSVVQDVHSRSAIENSIINKSEDSKDENSLSLNSDNYSSFNGDKDDLNPVTAVILSPIPNNQEQPENQQNASVSLDKTTTPNEMMNGMSSTEKTPDELIQEEIINKNNIHEVHSIENKDSPNNITHLPLESEKNSNSSDKTFGSPIETVDEKVAMAATTIQASFRGFQTRQNLKKIENSDESKQIENDEEVVINSGEVIKESQSLQDNEAPPTINEITESLVEDDDKLSAAATTIQANFRGFQTRKTMKSKPDTTSELDETSNSNERKTPNNLSPELIESVKEEVNDICKEAETIVAERSESVEGMVKGVEQVLLEAKGSVLPSISDSVQGVRGSATPPSVSDTDYTKEEVFDFITDVDEKTINAATTIQATFRGFQARKNLQVDKEELTDSMPDYPPPAAEEDYLQSLDDLPPPDFEALESSYSEDVPTEPLAPPPPPDQDSLVFNEEDEDKLMSLQKPQECDELPEHRLTLETDSSDSSLSSAATKIQAGVRGYLTRKQIQVQGDTGTTSTSTNVLDSDQSLSVSREEDGVRSAISTEEESEVCRHMVSPMEKPRSAGKRMSLGSSVVEMPEIRKRAPLRSALSVQEPGSAVSDNEVWDMLKSELSDAATTIQSNFRGYRARKQLQREDAMQVTSSSSQATPSAGSVDRTSAGSGKIDARSSGEYHDIIALTPPDLDVKGGEAPAQETAEACQPTDDSMVKRQADSDADESSAATKIQATFRGFKSRQEIKERENAAAKIQAGFRGYKVRREMKNDSPQRSSTPDKAGNDGRTHSPESVEESAATKIQAGVRGFLVRRRNQKGQDSDSRPQGHAQTLNP